MSQTSLDQPSHTCESPWDFLAAHLPLVDLTDAFSRMGANSESAGWKCQPDDDPFDALARALYSRRRRHTLVTGSKGVGKTSVVQELARRASAGDPPFLSDTRFLWIDCRNVGPEDSRAWTPIRQCSGRAPLPAKKLPLHAPRNSVSIRTGF